MATASWRASLESVRGRFEAGANQYEVDCVLIHWGARDLPIDQQLHGYPHRYFGLGHRVDGGRGQYRVRRLGRRTYRVITREHFYLCNGKKEDRVGAVTFERQATEAARCLSDVPPRILSQISTPSLKRHEHGNTSATHWVWFLFDLAWQQALDSPRHASRTIWGFVEGEDPGIPESLVCYRHDKAEIQSHFDKHGADGGRLPFLAKWVKRLPNRYFSVIPDVFAFSAWAVNVILALGQPATPGTDLDVKKSWNPTPETERIIADLKRGMGTDAAAEKYRQSAANIRQIRSRAKRYGMLPAAKEGET